jgi:integrase
MDETDVLVLVGRWQGAGLSPRTIKSLLSLLRRLAKYNKHPLPNLKPIVKMVIRSEQEKKIQVLTKEQVHTLIHGIDDEDFLQLVALGVFAGLRLGEAFGLTWENVDILEGTILVERSYHGPTKNGKSRVIPISRTLETIFLARMPLNSDNSIGVFSRWYDPNPRLKTLCKKLGLPDITFHGLRHTFATLALEAGRSPKQVQETLGHSTVSTTLNMYWQSLGDKMNLNFIDNERGENVQ